MEQIKREYRQERFQFVLSVNDNIICQRYFRINGFNRESLSSLQLKETIDEITTGLMNPEMPGYDRGIIGGDLASKSRVYLWYTNNQIPLKLTGFVNPSETSYITYDNAESDTEEWVGKIQLPWEATFKFSFLVDEKEVCSRIWDGSVYPRYVRDSVDITNKKSSYENEDPSRLSFSTGLIRHMTVDKSDLVYEIIGKFCEVLSSTYSEQFHYTKSITYGNDSKSKNTKKTYYLSIERDNFFLEKELERKYEKKTREYFNSLPSNMSKRDFDYYENCL